MGLANRRNVGVFAHVDAGKTTTTEYMLYECGKIRAPGKVDTGTSQTDWLDVERERGISVQAASTSFLWKDTAINLVDTPGHVDFLSEVERSMRVMDGAVLLVSAVEGVQAQTEAVWHALRTMNIPTIVYLNKMDRVGADPERTLAEIRRVLTPVAIPVQIPVGREQAYTGNCSLWQNPGIGAFSLQDAVERLAEADDAILERYLNGESLSPEELRQALDELARTGLAFPVLFGCSARGIGVAELLDAIVEFLPEPKGSAEEPVSGVVFKIERHKTMGKLAYVRMYGGTIRNRAAVFNATRNVHEKITQIRRMEGQRGEDIGLLAAGDIAAVCGLTSAQVGDILGNPAGVPPQLRMAVPLLMVRVYWQQEQDYPAVVAAMQELAEEDPLLGMQWHRQERELHINVMGPIQLEILTAVMKARFQLDVTFGQPSVIYKETPSRTAEGFYAYTMPKPCWAILRFLIEPGERGSGLVYQGQVRTEDLLLQYQKQVERQVPEALLQGLRGWEVTDLKVTLLYGEHHVWHTHPLDFVVATPVAIMEGLQAAGTTLLEPLLSFRITVPEELGGKVMADLAQMRAEFSPPETAGDRMTVEGKIPVATSLDYSVKLSSQSKGRGTMVTSFWGYQPAPPGTDVSRPRIGVNPLDHSRYILSVRNALSEEW
ncbi:GTP-binding protein [Gorillibacterium massiliense]|uniref:GTP-binding protein n=1 Tax=Gorillibacterium massiliense TaxID=1280390 RepID=UPI0004B2DC57|nr:TetM/TetW/TetO/TetS family tetracycline resistance ribosomal protection protein [Gorillibacterium massiliense]